MEDKKFTAFVSQDEPETETPETPAEGTEEAEKPSEE